MQPEKLIEKIEEMKHNPIAHELELFSLTFEKIGEKIEQIEKEFKEKELEFEPFSDKNLQYRESLERLKEIYFAVLFEIEAFNPKLIAKKPEEIYLISDPEPAAQEIELNPAESYPKLVKQYLDIAQYFRNDLKDHHLIPTEQKNKMIGQNLCFAVEAFCIEKFSEKIQSLWDDRENIIRSILDQENKKFKLHPELQKYLQDSIAEANSASIVNSLRFFLTLADKQQYKTTLLDASYFMLFFGQTKKIESLELKNYLNISIDSEETLVEMCSKLYKIHNDKLITLSVETPFSGANLAELQKNVEKILELLSNGAL